MSRLTPAIALPGLAAALLAGALAVKPAPAPAAEMTSVRLVAVAQPLVPERSPDNDEGDIGQADGSSKSDRPDFGLNSGGTRNARQGDEQQDILEGESKPGKPKSSDAQGGRHAEKDDEGDGGSWIGKLLDSIFSGIAKALG